MTPAAVAALAAAGAAAGLASGGVAVAVERVERLREEEEEERRAYERDVEREAREAGEGGRAPRHPPPWRPERYGWTWMERWLSPLLGAAAFAAFAAREAPGRALAIHLLWMALLVHIVVFDLKHRLILNRVTYPSVAAALALAPLTPGMSVATALLGAAAVFGFFLIQNLVSRGSIGLGDAKLGAVVGAITGLAANGSDLRAVYAVLYAVLLGGAVAAILLATRLRRLRDPIPYGPFLCAGAALVLLQAP